MSKSILFEQFVENRANFMIFYKTHDWRLETAAIVVYKKKHPQVILNHGKAWKSGRDEYLAPFWTQKRSRIARQKDLEVAAFACLLLFADFCEGRALVHG